MWSRMVDETRRRSEQIYVVAATFLIGVNSLLLTLRYTKQPIKEM